MSSENVDAIIGFQFRKPKLICAFALARVFFLTRALDYRRVRVFFFPFFLSRMFLSNAYGTSERTSRNLDLDI